MQSQKHQLNQELKTQAIKLQKPQISVSDPLLDESQTLSFFTYQIKGVDVNGEFNIRRRYSDFDLLRKKLSERWIGIYIPPISGKRANKNPLFFLKYFDSNQKQLKYAEIRSKFLHYFCQGVASKPYLYFCDIFQTFVHGGANFEQSLKNIPKKDPDFILREYQSNFTQMIPNLQFAQMLKASQNILQSLKKSQTNLQAVEQQAMKTAQARQAYNSQLNEVMNNSLPTYEETFLLSYVEHSRDKLVICKDQSFSMAYGKYMEMNNVNNSLEKFAEIISYEIRENKSFIETIEGRKSAQQRKEDLKNKIVEKEKELANLMQGGFNIKSIFKSGSKEEQATELNAKIDLYRLELNCIDKLILLMVANTAFELEEFKMKRGKEYAESFKFVAQKEIEEMNCYSSLLKIPQTVINA